MPSSIRLVVGIPTISSSDYIYQSLVRYKKEINMLPAMFNTSVVICINGEDNNNTIENEVSKFAVDQSNINVIILKRKEPGKNAALNLILEHARNLNCDIIHFLDDDVILKNGSLKLDIITLIDAQQNSSVPIMVGSNFYGIEQKLPDFINSDKNIISAIKNWILHKIFILPFRESADKTTFCIGQSLCAYMRYYPDYPDDATGIADDGFIGYYWAKKNKSVILYDKANPIIKPKDSVVYFRIAKTYKEWLHQQVRIYTGVYYACVDQAEDSNDVDFFADYFRWEYTIGKSSRRKGNEKGLKHIVKLSILRLFYNHVVAKSNRIITQKEVPPWIIARSTKNINIDINLNKM